MHKRCIPGLIPTFEGLGMTYTHIIFTHQINVVHTHTHTHTAITIQFTSSVFAADYDPTIGEQRTPTCLYCTCKCEHACTCVYACSVFVHVRTSQS